MPKISCCDNESITTTNLKSSQQTLCLAIKDKDKNTLAYRAEASLPMKKIVNQCLRMASATMSAKASLAGKPSTTGKFAQ
jgi:hypothetical protein